MSLKKFIPGTAERIQGKHAKYLQRKVRGHDVLLLVEWDDGQLTELGADYHPEKDGWFVATNGLVFAAVGDGVDTVSYYGVPTIRCHAAIACPFSTTACLQAEYDEAGQFRYDGQDGKTAQVIEVEDDGPPDPSAESSNGESAATDGGGVVKRRYDVRPPDGAVGHAFGLDEAKQRAPYPVSSNMIRRAIEYGKESARDEGKWLRMFLYGAGLVVGVLVVFGILYIIGASVLGGGGGPAAGGGGGGNVNMGSAALLVLAAARPAARGALGGGG